MARRLPSGARPVPPPAPRPLPGAPPGLLGVVAVEGRLLPVWCWEPAPKTWVVLENAVVGGSALCPAMPDAPLLCLPDAPAPARPVVPVTPPASKTVPNPPLPMTVVLRSGDASLAVPMTALRGIRSWPGLLAPVPGRPRGALGYADTADGPVLVLDPSWCFGVPAREADGHLAVLLHGGRQLGLPCSGAAPGTGTDEAVMTLLSRLQDTVPGAGLLALAPCSATEAPATPAVRRALLLFRSGAATFLLPAEAVYAVVPPQRPRPLPGGDGLAGVCAHRGLVLPVQDAARRLGTGTMPTTPPMLHLGGPHPVALAVSDVLGLRRVPADSFTPVAEDSLVEALVALEGRLVPLCRPAALAAP